MQKTNFPFVAIVHDDASTDKSAEIIREYAERYPNIIKPIFETENQYSKGTLDHIMQEACKASECKYIALCEGDDYWIDPLKLQKQVDFLETHLEYSLCFHSASIQNESKRKNNHITFSIETRDYSIIELFEKWVAPTASFVMRNEVIYSLRHDTRIINGDIHTLLNACCIGKVWGMAEKMSVYRIHDSGVTLKRAQDDYIGLQKKNLLHYQCLKELYPCLPIRSCRTKEADIYISIAVHSLKKEPIKSIKYLLFALYNSPYRFFERIFNGIFKIGKRYLLPSKTQQ